MKSEGPHAAMSERIFQVVSFAYKFQLLAFRLESHASGISHTACSDLGPVLRLGFRIVEVYTWSKRYPYCFVNRCLDSRIGVVELEARGKFPQQYSNLKPIGRIQFTKKCKFAGSASFTSWMLYVFTSRQAVTVTVSALSKCVNLWTSSVSGSQL